MSDFNNLKLRKLDGGLLLILRELLRGRRAVDVAVDLSLSPAAISHSLSRLREIFDEPLFVRRPYGLEPTERALQLKLQVETLVELSLELLTSHRGFEPAAMGRRFILSAPEFVAAAIGAPLLDRLSARAPNASLKIDFLAPDQALDALSRREIDVAIGRFGTVPMGLRAEQLYRDRYCIAMRSGHPAADEPLDNEGYKALDHIVVDSLSEGVSDPQHLQDWLGFIRMVASVPRWSTALALAAATNAVCTCPERLARQMAPILNLTIVPPPFPQDPFAVTCVRAARVQDERLDWLMDQLRAAVAPIPA